MTRLSPNARALLEERVREDRRASRAAARAVAGGPNDRAAVAALEAHDADRRVRLADQFLRADCDRAEFFVGTMRANALAFEDARDRLLAALNLQPEPAADAARE